MVLHVKLEFIEIFVYPKEMWEVVISKLEFTKFPFQGPETFLSRWNLKNDLVKSAR
jgi:hypothetical protein